MINSFRLNLLKFLKTSISIYFNNDIVCVCSLFYISFLDEVSYESLLHVGSLIFILSILGLCLNRMSVMLYMVGLEMSMLGCGFNFIIFSLYNNLFSGLSIALVILAIAAAETAVGLGIIVSLLW